MSLKECVCMGSPQRRNTRAPLPMPAGSSEFQASCATPAIDISSVRNGNASRSRCRAILQYNMDRCEAHSRSRSMHRYLQGRVLGEDVDMQSVSVLRHTGSKRVDTSRAHSPPPLTYLCCIPATLSSNPLVGQSGTCEEAWCQSSSTPS